MSLGSAGSESSASSSPAAACGERSHGNGVGPDDVDADAACPYARDETPLMAPTAPLRPDASGSPASRSETLSARKRPMSDGVQMRTVESSEAEAKSAWCVGCQATLLIGPSCPERRSSSLPVPR